MASRAAKQKSRPDIDDNSPKFRFYSALLEKLENNSINHPPPRIFYKGHNVEQHLVSVERYFRTTNVTSGRSKAIALLNSLDDSVQTQLMAQPGFDDNQDDYHWLHRNLCQLYGRRERRVSPRVHLLGIQQSPLQSPQDFANQLRVEAFTCWPQEEIDKKEDFLLEAFLHGLSDQKLASAIKALSPKSLEQAASSAQQFCPTIDPVHLPNHHLRAFNQNDIVMKLQHQVNELQKKILDLERILLQRENNRPKESRFPRHSPGKTLPMENRKVVCFQCKNEGHIARDCPFGRKCSHCGGTNHTSNMCWKNVQRKPMMRRLTNDEPPQNSDVDMSEQENLDECDSTVQKCCVITNSHGRDLRKVVSIKSPKSRYGASRMEEKVSKEWTDYILGRSGKPCMYQPTLISESHSEPAKNKPVVWGRCGNVKTKIFIDSGAEMNVIDGDLLNQLLMKQVPVKFIPSTSTIACANGSKMTVTGYAQLCLQIGNAKVNQKFMVVKRLFPKVIVGLRTMKTMGIVIDPSKDGIIVDEKTRVPFLSRIEPEVATSTLSVKARGSPLGAKVGPALTTRLHCVSY
jgi:hypothetical protein